ncbi:hypothetical protein Clacol_002738 [Clathrus columnatus]|uniref:EF-hand domain-containing protein n=1 Tax=Clathrus columnatus TaxID=1419009 RepID=A0AAV5A2Q2_9AGAM|nr:hypothetical protein Clacol_002738 [Clathrus columnatus]
MSYNQNYSQYSGGSSATANYNYGREIPPPPSRGPGGFATPAPAGPPPGADPQLWNWFSSVDSDRSGAISATELQQALVNGDWSPFDLDTVKLLMSIFIGVGPSVSVRHSEFAVLSFSQKFSDEFTGLWKYIKDWQNVFRHFDVDHSGSIDGHELANALKQFGYNLSPSLLTLLERKYVQASAAGSGITFDRFTRACVATKTLTEAFQRLDTDHDGWIQSTLRMTTDAESYYCYCRWDWCNANFTNVQKLKDHVEEHIRCAVPIRRSDVELVLRAEGESFQTSMIRTPHSSLSSPKTKRIDAAVMTDPHAVSQLPLSSIQSLPPSEWFTMPDVSQLQPDSTQQWQPQSQLPLDFGNSITSVDPSQLSIYK